MKTLGNKTDLKGEMNSNDKGVGSEIASVIIISYNNLQYLNESIDSVLSQNYPSIELIVSDDGTPDFPKEEIEQYIKAHANSNIVNVIVTTNETNSGIVKNVNKGISLSNGGYIKVLASDDKLYGENALSKYVSSFNENKEYDVFFSDAVIVYPDGKIEKHSNHRIAKNLKTSDEFFARLCQSNFFVAGTSCFRKSFFKKYGLFDERFFLLEDWPMWLKAARLGCKFGFIEEALFEYRASIGCSSASAKNPKFENDVENCYKYCVLPFLNQIDKRSRMAALDSYFEKCVHPKGRIQEAVFLAEKPHYCAFKIKRKLRMKLSLRF